MPIGLFGEGSPFMSYHTLIHVPFITSQLLHCQTIDTFFSLQLGWFSRRFFYFLPPLTSSQDDDFFIDSMYVHKYI